MRTDRSSQRPQDIGTAIRERRVKAGLTLAQLAAKVDTDKGTMSRIERGLARLTAERLLAIAAALGVDPVQLLQPH